MPRGKLDGIILDRLLKFTDWNVNVPWLNLCLSAPVEPAHLFAPTGPSTIGSKHSQPTPMRI